MVHEQSSILETDEDKALTSLATMIPSPEDRRSALALPRRSCDGGSAMSTYQKAVLSKINKALHVS